MIDIDINSTFKCDICGDIEKNHKKVAYGWDMPKPSLPEGWRVIDGTTVCLEHTVNYDDKKIEFKLSGILRLYIVASGLTILLLLLLKFFDKIIN